ncbi:hypothetical protein GGR39_001401 [Novosphingobium fluoreni]|uniref:Uncharacterized protein n=1 Tax=Novosphingobium fluoreni TaxID=1391222 RepID=A0A7W6C578_9SPHN|nr:hypothetical protein [Novosphingobium fluoreni]MBB3939761.1 hypothetical protein [Novosphingobium fluoreni]
MMIAMMLAAAAMPVQIAGANQDGGRLPGLAICNSKETGTRQAFRTRTCHAYDAHRRADRTRGGPAADEAVRPASGEMRASSGNRHAESALTVHLPKRQST